MRKAYKNQQPKESMKKGILVLSILLLLSQVLIIPLTSSDGGYFPKHDYWVRPGQQRAIIFYENNIETLIVTSEFQGDAKDLVWIIPTPSKPEISKANEEIFTNIQKLTRPEYNHYPRAEILSKDAFEGADDEQSVVVIDSKKIDYYNVTTVLATNSNELVRWFEENDYDYPEDYSYVLDYYIEKGWYFVAVKISAESIPSTEVLIDMKEGHPTPIKLVFQSDKIVFPLKISSVEFEQGFKISQDLKLTKQAIEHLEEIGYEELAKEKSAKKIFNQIITDVLSNKSYAQSIANNYSIIIPEHEYSNLRTPYCYDKSCIRRNLENVFRDYFFQNDIIIRYDYEYTYTPINLYIVADSKYEDTNFHINYANWVKKKDIEKLGKDENGDQLIQPKSSKYFVTSLSASLQKSQMDDDIYFEKSEDNKKVNAGPETWELFTYGLLIIFLVFLGWFFTPLGILFIIGALMLFLTKNKIARIFGWIMQGFSVTVTSLILLVFLNLFALNNAWNYTTSSILIGTSIITLLMIITITLEVKFIKTKKH